MISHQNIRSTTLLIAIAALVASAPPAAVAAQPRAQHDASENAQHSGAASREQGLQQVEAAQDRAWTRRRFSISYDGLAAISGGPATDIEAAMGQAGLGDTSPCFFFCDGGVAHPVSHSAEEGWLVAMDYALGEHFSVGLVVSDGELGSTSGYKSDGRLFMSVDYSARTIAPLAIFRPPGLPLRLGLGPAYYTLRASQDDFFEAANTWNTNRVGLLGDVRLVTSASSRIFFELRAQYRLADTPSAAAVSVTGSARSRTRRTISRRIYGVVRALPCSCIGRSF